MSLLPAFIHARKRDADSVPSTEPETDSRGADSHGADSHDASLDDNVFDLLSPQLAETAAPEPKPQGRNRHPVDMTDLSRLSIDREGRLYWDGKPVETHHRLAMSRAQIVGASIVAALVAISAISGAIQGAASARDWACLLGWASGTCAQPYTPKRPDIPA